MPYTGSGDKSLPDYVKKLSKDKRSQWIKIFNDVYQKCIADDGTAKKCESFAFKNASGVVIKKGKKKSMGDLKTIFQGIVGVFADAMGIEQSQKKQRDMGMLRLREMVWVLLKKDESYAYLLDVYRSDAGEFYAVLVDGGKLYRQSVTIDGETVTLGERIQVGELFPPVERAALTITRQADGGLRWTMIAATAVVNRVGEIDSTQLFENLAAHADNPDVPYPYLTFYHCGENEKLRLGTIDYLARDGYVYINSGLLDQDNALAMAIARDCASSGEWGGSIHYDPIGEPECVEVAPDIFIPVYRDGIHIETSIVLENSAAALFTILGANKEVLRRMEQKVKDKLQELLGDDAEQWVALADEVNRKIDEEGYVARTQEGGKPAPPEPTPTQDDPPQEPKPPAIDQTLELDEEALGLIVRGIAESDAFKGQFTVLETGLTALNGTLETLTKQLESNSAASTEALVKVRERLDALEKDEEQKQREWLEDVPQRKMLRVTYRPSRDNAPDGPRQSTGTLADVADATLANMPSMS